MCDDKGPAEKPSTYIVAYAQYAVEQVNRYHPKGTRIIKRELRFSAKQRRSLQGKINAGVLRTPGLDWAGQATATDRNANEGPSAWTQSYAA